MLHQIAGDASATMLKQSSSNRFNVIDVNVER